MNILNGNPKKKAPAPILPLVNAVPFKEPDFSLFGVWQDKQGWRCWCQIQVYTLFQMFLKHKMKLVFNFTYNPITFDWMYDSLP